MPRRGNTVFLTVLGALGALSLFGYFQTRATWRTATEAEVREVIDPALLVEAKVDPAARARYDRMVKIVSAMKNRIGPGAPNSQRVAAFLQGEKANIDALEAVLGEGPLERAIPDWGTASLSPLARITLTVKMLAQAAEIEAQAGRVASAARLLRLGLQLAFGLAGHHVGTIDTAFQNGQAMTMFRALYPVLPQFREPELAAIAKAIPPATPVDEDYRRGIRLDFQGLILPALADPRARDQKATRDPRAPRQSDLAGSYDALETARFMSDGLMASLANAGVRRPQLNDVYAPRVRLLFLSLPTDHMAGATGLWVPIRKAQYRIEMARTQNSFARRLFYPILENGPAYTKASLQGRALREATHSLIALYRYRLRHGSSAPSLDRLVQTGLLPALPVDYMGKGLLRYDPVRRRLWSVGENGIDDGGTASMNSPSAPDYIWSTP